MSDEPQIDRLAGSLHPRQATVLLGHEAAELELLEAYREGRLHHGWIVTGPEGIGKATLAYRMAKFVLSRPEPATLAKRRDLATDPNELSARQVVSQSHVDLSVLRRAWNPERKSFYTEIRAEDARRLPSFFSLTAGSGGWRVAIVDAADDLNAQSANALLKLLEEPPSRALILIVSHNPGRLLPTIRSRCRRLALKALDVAAVARAAGVARPDIDADTLANSAAIAEGSVRRAISLADGDGTTLHAALMALLRQLPKVDIAAAHALADLCAGRSGDENFALLLSFLENWLHERLRHDEGLPGHRLARWAEVWEKVRGAARDVEIYNLDRKPFILSTVSMLAKVS